ncbi:hypothetical protein IX317_002016 [Fusobacterium sp. DD29]|uniref:hypothetical protein n=1 Tax=unclassified Fusobacterium TaxID=2648384 RepID=UPI001B8A973C|nr:MULTISPECIES: hypothetical protein [unclassified Fusobacterium]MBR8702031.1 hypothetical protein [Fusobacterium sp. DD45]MBR8711824.1 hypothetical protein [Fusobacterium sp. DD28]MBR8750297.1 hypothetical protein [Fusobacterium sp. DD29]MBR8752386.1 hypothetical protein [Fusobacterium sp. DD26]MBR8762538.1 hypothetical protein [Fusobacterium sp. DD25]
MEFKRAANEHEAKKIMELQFQHDDDFIFLGSFFTNSNINIIHWQQTDNEGEIIRQLSVVKFNYDLTLLPIEDSVIDEIARSFIGERYEVKCQQNKIYVIKEVKRFVC